MELFHGSSRDRGIHNGMIRHRVRAASVALLLFVWVSTGSVEAQQTPEASAGTSAAEMRVAEVYDGCRVCHGIPDTRTPQGSLWVGRVATTACVQPMGQASAPLRSVMQDYLRGERQQEPLDRPRVESKPRPVGAAEGVVRLLQPGLSLLLVPQDEDGTQPVRLLTSMEESEAEMTRVVASGRYRVQAYQLQRIEGDVLWAVWGGGTCGRTLVVEPGAEQLLRIDDRVHVEAQVVATDASQSRLGLSVTGDSGMGLTVIRASDRVPAHFSGARGDGSTAQGTLSYG